MSTTPPLNLYKELCNYFPPDLTSVGAIELGETEQGLLSLISASIPAVLMAVIRKGGSSTTHAAGILFVALSAREDAALRDCNDFYDTANSRVHEFGIEILTEVMDNRLPVVIHSLAAFSKTRRTSVQTVLEFICSMTMVIIGNYCYHNNLAADDVKTWLAAQQQAVAATFPPGLLIAGFNTVIGGNGVHRKQEREKTIEQTRGLHGKKIKTTLAIAALLLLLLGGFFVFKLKS